MSWHQIGAIQLHSLLGIPDKGYAIKRLVVSNDWDIEHLELFEHPVPPLIFLYFGKKRGMGIFLVFMIILGLVRLS